MNTTKTKRNIFLYLLLIGFALVMIYPLLWLFSASFKTNQEIFGSLNLFPASINFSAYSLGWKGTGQFTFGLFFANTFILVIPLVVFALLSNTLVAYGFARFRFPLKQLLFSIMISTLMLPSSITLIPNYILFRNLKWLDSYLPFYVPALCGSAFFTFLLIQFYRGMPKELDESAKIDGCNSFKILYRILMPLSTPALFSIGIFQFIWMWNDFFNQLIYINSVKKFTISLALRMTLDTASAINWNQIMAMSVVSILPCVIIFFLAQKYFVEGISTTGLKG